jgi:hypothetical protein
MPEPMSECSELRTSSYWCRCAPRSPTIVASHVPLHHVANCATTTQLAAGPVDDCVEFTSTALRSRAEPPARPSSPPDRLAWIVCPKPCQITGQFPRESVHRSHARQRCWSDEGCGAPTTTGFSIAPQGLPPDLPRAASHPSAAQRAEVIDRDAANRDSPWRRGRCHHGVRGRARSRSSAASRRGDTA